MGGSWCSFGFICSSTLGVIIRLVRSCGFFRIDGKSSSRRRRGLLLLNVIVSLVTCSLALSFGAAVTKRGIMLIRLSL